MKKIHETMERVFEQTGLDPTDLANAINTSPQNVTNWSSRGISKNGAMDISKKFDISVDWILTGRETEETATYKNTQGNKKHIYKSMKVLDVRSRNNWPQEIIDFPITNIVSWDNIYARSSEQNTLYTHRPLSLDDNGFAMIIKNESMSPMFNPDDIVFIEPNKSRDSLRDGDFVIVKRNTDAEAMIKEVMMGEKDNDIFLIPYNPDWRDQERVILMDEECKFIGRVVGKHVRY